MESLLTKTYSPPLGNDAIIIESNGKAVLQDPPSISARKTNKPSLSSSTEIASKNDRERAEEGICITLGEPPTHCEPLPPPSTRSTDILVGNRSFGLTLHNQSREHPHEDRALYETPNTHNNSPVTNRRDSGVLQKRESSSSTEAEYGGHRSRIDKGQRSNVASEDVRQISMVDIEEEKELISHQELKSFELLDVSEFESDSSDSLLEVAFSTSVSTDGVAAAQSTSSSIVTATTQAGSSSAQFNQSKLLLR